MGKTLGLDLGTNSIGWAVVNEEEQKIVDCGVRIFPAAAEGIGTTKEALLNVKRRAARQMRRQVYRRKLRKVKLLETLIHYHMCPLKMEELDQWRKRAKGKVAKFPSVPEFVQWLRQNPLYLRDKATKEFVTRMEFGRILYHLIQKRGFLSNRKSVKDSGAMYKGKQEEGIIGISKTEEELKNAVTFGSFLYGISKKEREKFFQQEERVRGRYTLRDWYIQEFKIIWEKQAEHLELDRETAIRRKKSFLGNEETKQAKKKIDYLNRTGKIFRIENKYLIVEETVSLKDYLGDPKQGILFYQRPLRSQKNLLSVCTFEQREIAVAGTDKRRIVGKKVCPISHPDFEKYRVYKFVNTIRYGTDRPLEEQERKIAAEFLFSLKKATEFKKLVEKLELTFEKFNYPYDFKIFASPYIATVKKAVPLEVWKDPKKYEDLWHSFYFYDDEERLKEKLEKDFGVAEKNLAGLLKFSLPEGYANLSKKAITNILEFLEKGIPEHIAILLGGVKNAAGKEKWEGLNPDDKRKIEEEVSRLARERKEAGQLIKEVAEFVHEYFHIDYGRIYSHLYHHSEKIISDGIKEKLEEVENLRNPIVQQTLNEMKKLVNALISEHLEQGEHFDSIKVELARELKLPKGKRMMIWKENSEREKENMEACAELDNYGLSHSRENIHKYLLWKELRATNGTAVCPYTGKTIDITDLFGEDNRFQIEHIIPYSISMDDSLSNKTLCESKENNSKGNLTPYQFYRNTPEKWEEIKSRAFRVLPYFKAKRFASTADYRQEEFISRQLNDTRYITKKAVEYLSSICPRVLSLPGSLTADLRTKWGMNSLIREPAWVDPTIVRNGVNGNCWAEFGEAEHEQKITKLYRKWNRKPEPDLFEIVISGEILDDEFIPDSKFKLKSDKIQLSQKKEDGKYWACVRIVPKALTLKPILRQPPEKEKDEIILTGKIYKNQFQNKAISPISCPVSFQEETSCYCRLRIDRSREIVYGKEKMKQKEGTLVLRGEVKDGWFQGRPNVFQKKTSLPDGYYFAVIPYLQEQEGERILPMRNKEPEWKENQILLSGKVQSGKFIPYMNPKFQLDTEQQGRELPEDSYWCVCNLSGEIRNYVRKENLPPKLDKQVRLEEGEVRYNGETEEYFFYGKKDRTDHRHHAVDAITIALANQGHFQKLSTFNAGKMARRQQKNRVPEKLHFPLPWESFVEDAKKSVASIIISHKYHNPTIKMITKQFVKDGKKFMSRGAAARGQLHKETVYGQHLHPKKTEDGKFLFDENQRIVTEKESYYHVRKRLSDLTKEKQINKIVDETIRKLIKKKIDESGGFRDGKVPNGALFRVDPETGVEKTKVFLPNKKGDPVPVYKVRISENLEKARSVKPSYQENEITYNQYVNPRNNHHVMIYRTEKGDLTEKVVQFWDAVQWKQQGNSIYQLPEDGSELVTTMEINEMFLLGLQGEKEEILAMSTETLSQHLYRVQKLATKDYVFRYHLDSSTDKKGEVHIQSFGKWEEMNPIKVKISFTGKISLC